MENLSFEVRDGIGLVTLNRPKALNAINSALVAELDALLEAQSGADLRAMVITGSGDRAFAAGADISEMAAMTAAQAGAFSAAGHRAMARMEALAYPTIAAVKGFALGGGCELAMACDLILASPTATFGQPEVKLGVIPGFGGTQRLVRRVGRQRALELMLTGRNVKALEAVKLGLVLDVVEGEDVVDAAMALGARIARNGPAAVALVKRCVHQSEGRDAEAGHAAEQAMFALCFATEDQTEGMAAFLEKRPADFTGR
jgi:enoyl-CoA hydratase